MFPFSVDKEAVLQDHPQFWPGRRTWFDGLDAWIDHAANRDSPSVAEKLGPWKRDSWTRFDLESEAYQTMVFFHPFVRRVFFDTADRGQHRGRAESLLNWYTIPLDGKDVVLRAEDVRGRKAEVRLNEIRMFLFANGIGILSIGVEAFDVSAADALWINDMMRKVYPSSGRQIRESRTPKSLQIVLRDAGVEHIVLGEAFTHGSLENFNPRLAATITGLLYFADYEKHEYSAVLDERMLVYTYAAIDQTSVPDSFRESEDFQVLLSRFLYVDRFGTDFRYDREFIRKYMNRQLYRRWAHQGTWYGFTTYSNITLTIGTFDCDDHSLQEGFLIHRMFNSRYFLMANVALFYRATLLDFAESAALVSKRLYLDQADGRLTRESIDIANQLRGDFLHFTNYWFFDELANKDEEMEHFQLQCRVYRVESMRSRTEEEIERLNASLHEYYQNQSAVAVNRLAIVSTVLGAGAVLTGYFGMNFEREFHTWVFNPSGEMGAVLHYSVIAAVTAFAVASLAFAGFLISANWHDYRQLLLPGRIRAPQMQSLRRTTGGVTTQRPAKAGWVMRRRSRHLNEM